MRAEGTFRGRLSDFPEVRALVEGLGTAAGLDRTATLRVILVLEELFTNTVAHGYTADDEGPVWVTLTTKAGTIEVIYEDAAPAFDPLADGPPAPDDSWAADDRPPGGLGLALVRGLSREARYARVSERNRVTLTLPTARHDPR